MDCAVSLLHHRSIKKLHWLAVNVALVFLHNTLGRFTIHRLLNYDSLLSIIFCYLPHAHPWFYVCPSNLNSFHMLFYFQRKTQDIHTFYLHLQFVFEPKSQPHLSLMKVFWIKSTHSIDVNKMSFCPICNWTFVNVSIAIYLKQKCRRIYWKSSVVFFSQHSHIIKHHRGMVQLGAEWNIGDGCCINGCKDNENDVSEWEINWFTFVVHKFYQAIWTQFNKFCFIAWNGFPLAEKNGRGTWEGKGSAEGSHNGVA